MGGALIRGVRTWVLRRSKPGPNAAAPSPAANARRSARSKADFWQAMRGGSRRAVAACSAESASQRTPPEFASSSSVKKPAWPLRVFRRSSPPMRQS
ncbi:hypothetical protein BE04_31320 [Sorangium cellulosum]|uniref:Uncharacterized protein n=1 Tax=Sorangium cellulosum TaxID=56 RepID=A0A150P6B3_SORCE|nr:hypothetical protein BE04_31320 [Sorangium cellulosum]